ncbi:MAG: flagellar hook-associated protein FlgL [Gammaproteobacteria bacterium]|nr:flagellar hook-associated protein FlgL [Gammaproteobacteria bacterium]
MRLGTFYFNDRITNDMLKAQAEMADAQLRLSTGRRIVNPSDDPSGAKAVLDTEKFLATTAQYQENIQQIKPRLELEETVLANAIEIMQRAREMSIQGATGVYTVQDRSFIADEIDQLLDQMLSLAGTKDANDEYLFSGYNRKQEPVLTNFPKPPTLEADGSLPLNLFTYAGDQGDRKVPIAANRQVADTDNGYDTFFRVPDVNGGRTDVFSTLYDLSATLRVDTTDPALAFEPDYQRVLKNIESAMDHMMAIRAKAGARAATVDQQESANADFILNFESQLSNIRDLDYAEAITKLNRDTTALQAAQNSYVKIQGINLFNYL